MKRLTGYNSTTKHAYYTACFDDTLLTECDGLGAIDSVCDLCPQQIAACDKLAAYEDTGLTPEQVAELRAAYDRLNQFDRTQSAKLLKELAAYRWIPVTERLPESGQTVLAGWRESCGIYTATGQTDEADEPECTREERFSQYTLVDFYRAGDKVDDEIPVDPNDTPTQRLLRVITSTGNRTIEQDGFYMYQPGSDGWCRYVRHADIITHWMALPQVPEVE